MTEEQKILESWTPDYTNEQGEEFYEKGKVAIILSEHRQNGVKNNFVLSGVSGSAIRCFECKETKNLIKDTVYRDTHWCKEHYKERHAIISDFINHAMTGQ